MKKFYLYEELVQNIKKNINLINISESTSNRNEKIFNSLPEYYIKTIIENQKNILEIDLDGSINISYSYLEKNVKYPSDYKIISTEIYNQIKERNNAKINGIKSSFVINSKKIILEYNYNSLFELLIGEINILDFKLIPSFVLKYKEENYFNYHYKLIQHNNLKKFFAEKLNENVIIEKNYIVGKFYFAQEKQKNII